MRSATIVAGLLQIVAFCLYYAYAVQFWGTEQFRQEYADYTNWTIWLCMAVVFLFLGMNEKNRLIRYLVYYAFVEFWLFLIFTYIFESMIPDLITMYKVVFVLIAVFVTSIFIFIIKKLWLYLK